MHDFLMHCLFSAIIQITFIGGHDTLTAQFDGAPKLSGVCATDMYDYLLHDQVLVIQSKQTRYVMELPNRPGTFQLAFRVGSHFAKYAMVPKKDASRPDGFYFNDEQWLEMPVRYGPLAFY